MNPPPPRDKSQALRQDRASFQSPTRASLARSHPEVLARAMSRSPARRPTNKGNQNGKQEQADSRIFGLRDRKALRPSLTSTASPMDGSRPSGGANFLSPSRLSNVFAAPPRRVSRKIVPADLAFGSPVRQSNPEPPHINTPDDQLASELDSATAALDAHADFEPGSLHDEFEEPELPPTPTQLGLEKLPERPKGLLSSSPSARHGKRSRRRTTDTLQPSPLKFRNLDSGADAEEFSGLALESNQVLLPEPVSKKQRLKKDLSAEIEQLRKDIVELESWTDKINQPEHDMEPAGQDFNKLISLLISQEPSLKASSESRPSNAPISSLLSTLLPFSTKASRTKRQTSPLPTNPFALQESAQTKPYLTVFAPLSLTAHSNEISTSKSEALLETHTITLSAPQPFPPNYYQVSVVYETNPETLSIISIFVPPSSENIKTNIPEALRRWTNSRLENPLLRLDVSGLCWGINRYWEASLSRAQMWMKMKRQHSKLVSGRGSDFGGADDKAGNQLSSSDMRWLIPHVDRTTMLFGTEEKPLKLLLSCTLAIDEWTSEPQLIPEISISISTIGDSSSRKIEQEARKLFHGLISEHKDGHTEGLGNVDSEAIVRATEGVLSTLFDDGKGKAPKKG